MPAELTRSAGRMMQLQIELEALRKRRTPRRAAAAEGREGTGRASGAQQRAHRALGERKGRDGHREEHRRERDRSQTQFEQAQRRATGGAPRGFSTARCATSSAASPRPRDRVHQIGNDGKALVKDEVTPDENRDVVSRWTGVPVTGCSKASARSSCRWKSGSPSA
jgi:ATP-dependent Clp protease ATP-binding subunit ClpB